MSKFFLKTSLLFLVTSIYGQLSQFSSPNSFVYEFASVIPIFKTADLNIDKLNKDDFIDIRDGRPYRFGYSFPVDINFFDLAICDTLENGDKIFRLQIESKDAYSINMIFDDFYLSQDTKLFIYNHNKSHSIGAFTSKNNKAFNRFSTAPVSGDKIIME